MRLELKLIRSQENLQNGRRLGNFILGQVLTSRGNSNCQRREIVGGGGVFMASLCPAQMALQGVVCVCCSTGDLVNVLAGKGRQDGMNENENETSSMRHFQSKS